MCMVSSSIHQTSKKLFAKRIKDVLYPDAKTRQNKFVEALQDPKESLRIAMLWDMVKSGQLQLNASKSSAAATRKLTDLLGKRKSAGAAPRLDRHLIFPCSLNRMHRDQYQFLLQFISN